MPYIVHKVHIVTRKLSQAQGKYINIILFILKKTFHKVKTITS